MTTTTTAPLAAVARRWPTVLGFALGADVFLGEVTAAVTDGYARLLLLMPLLYVVVAVLRQRRASWPVFGVLIALFVLLRLQDGIEPAVVVLAAALGATIWGAGHGRHREHDFRVQLAGMIGFAAVAVAGLAVHPDLGRYLVAAGMLAHGIWDWVHMAKDRTVAHSYAEWCGALDVTVAVGLVVVPLL
jgi:Ni/Fe-hydrogenase subunit HybB-like protein